MATTGPQTADNAWLTGADAVAGRQESVYDAALATARVDDGTRLPHHGFAVDEDRYLQQIVEVQFDEETGAPYWQDVHADLQDTYGEDFDIRDKVAAEGFDAVRRYLPESDEAALKERPMTDFRPSFYDPADIHISKSSGTTGKKKIMPVSTRVTEALVDWYDWNLDRYGEEGGDWLVAGPPGWYEELLSETAGTRDGHMYFNGIETRELKPQLGALADLGAARDALAAGDIRGGISRLHDLGLDGCRQAYRGLARISPTMQAVEEDLASEPVAHIASAPQLVDEVADMLSGDRTVSDPADIRTVLISGTGVDADTVDGIAADYPAADVIPMYATSFTAAAFDQPFTDEITYYPMAPAVNLDVLAGDSEEPVSDRQQAEYGEEGQLVIDRIGPAFFWPNQTERDAAERVPPPDHSPIDWDGVGPITPR